MTRPLDEDEQFPAIVVVGHGSRPADTPGVRLQYHRTDGWRCHVVGYDRADFLMSEDDRLGDVYLCEDDDPVEDCVEVDAAWSEDVFGDDPTAQEAARRWSDVMIVRLAPMSWLMLRAMERDWGFTSADLHAARVRYVEFFEATNTALILVGMGEEKGAAVLAQMVDLDIRIDGEGEAT